MSAHEPRRSISTRLEQVLRHRLRNANRHSIPGETARESMPRPVRRFAAHEVEAWNDATERPSSAL